MEGGAWQATSPWGCKELDTTERLHFHFLSHFEFIFVCGMRVCSNLIDLHDTNQLSSEKAMAPHSSTLAWKIPWTEEPDKQQSMGRKESDMTEQLQLCIVDIFILT